MLCWIGSRMTILKHTGWNPDFGVRGQDFHPYHMLLGPQLARTHAVIHQRKPIHMVPELVSLLVGKVMVTESSERVCDDQCSPKSGRICWLGQGPGQSSQWNIDSVHLFISLCQGGFKTMAASLSLGLQTQVLRACAVVLKSTCRCCCSGWSLGSDSLPHPELQTLCSSWF